MSKCYTKEELAEIAQADNLCNAEWLAAMLNSAYDKGRQHSSESLKEAVRLLSVDMHRASSRPCGTCKVVSGILGEPFGCDGLASNKAKARAQLLQQPPSPRDFADETARLHGVNNVLADELAKYTGGTMPDEIEKACAVVDNDDGSI